MSVLILDARVERQIAKALELARDQTVPWDIIRNVAVEPRVELTLKDRKNDNPFPRSQHLTLGSYRCDISFEQQPAGLCRHLSVSVAKRGKVPSEIAIQMLAEAFGFSEFPPRRGRVWLEEFEPGHHAVNVVEVEREPDRS